MILSPKTSNSKAVKSIFNYRIVFAYLTAISFICMQYLVSQSSSEFSNRPLIDQPDESVSNLYLKKRDINSLESINSVKYESKFIRNFLSVEYDEAIQQKSTKIQKFLPKYIELTDTNIIKFDSKNNQKVTRMYNLKNPSLKYSSQIMQDQILMCLLNTSEFNKINASYNGIFVEAGAYDGETWSNTLYLERFRNWSGLLIEPSSENYYKLRTKNRKAYSVNNCICPGENSIEKSYIEAGPFGITTNKSKNNLEPMNNSVTCHPLNKILNQFFHDYFPHKKSNIARTKNKLVIDYMSLDIEGFEYNTIKTFPWNKFQFNFISIEYNQKQKNYKWLKNFLRRHGYYETFIDDVWYQDMYLAHKSVYKKLNLNVNKVSKLIQLNKLKNQV